MRKFIIIILILSMILVGCATTDLETCPQGNPDLYQRIPSEDCSSQTDPSVPLEDTVSDPVISEPTPTIPTVPDPFENSTEETELAGSTEEAVPTDTQSPQQATETPTTPTVPTEEAKPTTPLETKPTEPPATEPEENEPPVTEPKETEPQIDRDSYEFKLQVVQYAVQYINQYRAAAGVSPCEVLPGMTLVAEYRADQLTYNYSHDTADKREALAYFEYGKWVDATIVGLDPSESYYDADAAEAICAGFEGKTAEEMGKYIADLCRNSSSHWSYVGSSKCSYIGIGVEYRAGTAYGWYCCIMVGRTNYG